MHTTAEANIASCLFDELPSIRMARFASATQSSLSISQEGGLSWEIEFGDPISCTQLTVAPPRKAPHWSGVRQAIGPALAALTPLADGAQHQNERPSVLGFGFSLIAFTRRHLPAATTTFDDGPKTSATERARRRFHDVERSHERSKYCERGIEHHSGKGCFWFSWRPSPYN